MTFAQYIVFNEDMNESDVNDNAEDLSKGCYLRISHCSYWGQNLSPLVYLSDQSLVPNIGEDARAKDDVKEF